MISSGPFGHKVYVFMPETCTQESNITLCLQNQGKEEWSCLHDSLPSAVDGRACRKRSRVLTYSSVYCEAVERAKTRLSGSY